MKSHDSRRVSHYFHLVAFGAALLCCMQPGMAETAPVAKTPATSPAQMPAPPKIIDPSDAEKAASRAIYKNYIGNTLTCWYTDKDTCHLWLYADGTFDSFGYVNGKKTLNIDYPPKINRKDRTGLSWWGRGNAGNYELCLAHNIKVMPMGDKMGDGKVCYKLQNNHQIGEVWEEPDGNGRVSRMGLVKGFQ
jgi:hypothetical protein